MSSGQTTGDVFVSYARDDREFVGNLARQLRQKGIPFWLDSMIPPGEDWISSIEARLDTCSAFVVVMSEASRKSRWVQSELARALRKNIPVVPVLLSGEVFLPLESTQFVDGRGTHQMSDVFFDRVRQPRRSFEKLLDSTQTATPHAPKHIEEPLNSLQKKMFKERLFMRSQYLLERAVDPRQTLLELISVEGEKLPQPSVFKAALMWERRLVVEHQISLESWARTRIEIMRVKKRDHFSAILNLWARDAPGRKAVTERARQRIKEEGWGLREFSPEFLQAADEFNYMILGNWPSNSQWFSSDQSEPSRWLSRGQLLKDVSEAVVRVLEGPLELSADQCSLRLWKKPP